MKSAEKIGRIVIVLFVLAAVLLFVLPGVGSIRADVVLSGSMEPSIKTGAVIFTNAKACSPKEGDIIMYRLGEILVTHRVVKVKNGSYITKGDANTAEDLSPVKSSQVVGTVMGSIPYLGYMVLLLKRKTVFALLLAMLIQEFLLSLLHWKGERKGECADR